MDYLGKETYFRVNIVCLLKVFKVMWKEMIYTCGNERESWLIQKYALQYFMAKLPRKLTYTDIQFGHTSLLNFLNQIMLFIGNIISEQSLDAVSLNI